MNNQFDFNIQNYKHSELEEIFGLPPKQYNMKMIENKVDNFNKIVQSDKTIQASVKEKAIRFIESAKNILANQLEILQGFQKLSDADIYNIDYKLKSSRTVEEGNNFIIEKPATPYTQSLPSEYYQGVINPLTRRIVQQNISVDTRFRENYYSSSSTNFHFDLPIRFTKIVSMQLSAFEFPSSAFSISKKSGNNFFWVSTHSFLMPDDKEEGLIFIPDGTYTPQGLVNYLNYFVKQPPFSTDKNILNTIVFSLNLDNTAVSTNTNNNTGNTGSGSGQIVVSLYTGVILPADATLSLNFQANYDGMPDYSTPLPLKLGWMMGFRLGYYENNTNYVTEGIADTSGSKYMYLAIDDYNNNVNNGFYAAFNSSILNKNILARISTQTSSLQSNSQNNLSLITNPRKYFGPVDIQKLNIQLLDEYGRVIDLNNMDYSFCLTFQSVYDL